MVPAGQWQAVKDTLSRPNVRNLTTSDTLGNPTTSTAYSNYITTTPCNSYTTTNDTAISLQILCYDTLDTAISKLWLSLQPIPYVLELIQQSHMIQQAIKSPFSYWYNKLVRPYTTIDTARLRYVTTLPSIQQANYYYVTTSLFIPQAITFYTPITHNPIR